MTKRGSNSFGAGSRERSDRIVTAWRGYSAAASQSLAREVKGSCHYPTYRALARIAIVGFCVPSPAERPVEGMADFAAAAMARHATIPMTATLTDWLM